MIEKNEQLNVGDPLFIACQIRDLSTAIWCWTSRAAQSRDSETVGYVYWYSSRRVKKLERIGLLVSRRDGNRLYYAADQTHSIYPDLHNLVLKTSGLVDLLKSALKDADIQIAFVFGSVARGQERSDSDVDLMVIGNLGLRGLSHLLSGVPDVIRREINSYTLTEEEFQRRVQEGEHFITHVLKAPKLFITGTEDELDAMGG